MKQFFKFMFASMLGTFIVLALVTLITIGIIAAIVATASTEETVISKTPFSMSNSTKRLPTVVRKRNL